MCGIKRTDRRFIIVRVIQGSTRARQVVGAFCGHLCLVLSVKSEFQWSPQLKTAAGFSPVVVSDNEPTIPMNEVKYSTLRRHDDETVEERL